jgi:hypothetical protein
MVTSAPGLVAPVREPIRVTASAKDDALLVGPVGVPSPATHVEPAPTATARGVASIDTVRRPDASACGGGCSVLPRGRTVKATSPLLHACPRRSQLL